MNKHFSNIILKSTGASSFKEGEVVQNLWSGYGSIIRIYLQGIARKSVIVKHVNPPKSGKSDSFSHKRKLKSYKVETEWYRDYAAKCNNDCRVPECLALEEHGNEMFMILEDLDDSGYYIRKNYVTWAEMQTGISWLASFHALFLKEKPEGLWKTGTYWHLATRPDELKYMKDQNLKNAAGKIDQILNNCRYKTFVHGDAKLANFCFNSECTKSAMVDFQYTGGGCGMKDLAYYTGSCMNDDEAEVSEIEILDYYFSCLKNYINKYQKDIDAAAVEDEWRSLYRFAWVDFHRFYKGWAPGSWRKDSYSERIAAEVIASL